VRRTRNRKERRKQTGGSRYSRSELLQVEGRNCVSKRERKEKKSKEGRKEGST
jgi:hypothetical protein